jgi:hypothetical protein
MTDDTFTVAGREFIQIVKDIEKFTKTKDLKPEDALNQLKYLRNGLPTIGDQPAAKEIYLKLIELCDFTIQQIKQGMN